MKQFGLPVDELNSFILLKENKIYTKSTGALKILKSLDGILPLNYSFIIVPKILRDAVYSFIAKHRYKWFGKKDECWIPTPELQQLFLDN
jgi:predicted DCC family thiol-disulfide oxidoreductase YuxK